MADVGCGSDAVCTICAGGERRHDMVPRRGACRAGTAAREGAGQGKQGRGAAATRSSRTGAKRGGRPHLSPTRRGRWGPGPRPPRSLSWSLSRPPPAIRDATSPTPPGVPGPPPGSGAAAPPASLREAGGHGHGVRAGAGEGRAWGAGAKLFVAGQACGRWKLLRWRTAGYLGTSDACARARTYACSHANNARLDQHDLMLHRPCTASPPTAHSSTQCKGKGSPPTARPPTTSPVLAPTCGAWGPGRVRPRRPAPTPAPTGSRRRTCRRRRRRRRRAPRGSAARCRAAAQARRPPCRLGGRGRGDMGNGDDGAERGAGLGVRIRLVCMVGGGGGGSVRSGACCASLLPPAAGGASASCAHSHPCVLAASHHRTAASQRQWQGASRAGDKAAGMASGSTWRQPHQP